MGLRLAARAPLIYSILFFSFLFFLLLSSSSSVSSSNIVSTVSIVSTACNVSIVSSCVSSVNNVIKKKILEKSASRAVKTFLGYLSFIFYQNCTRFLSNRTVSFNITIWIAAMYACFFHNF